MSSPASLPVSQAIDKSVHFVLTQYGEALKNKNVEGILKLWSDNGVWLCPVLPAIIGKSALRECYTRILEADSVGGTMHFQTLGTFCDAGAGDNPNIVYTYGTVMGTFKLKDGSTAHAPQKYLCILNLINNEWKLAAICFNVTGEVPSTMFGILNTTTPS